MPQDTSIGKIKYDQGLRVGGTLNVAGFSATSMVDIDPQQGISAVGSLSPVHIADVFSLTADGDIAHGPSLDIEVKATQLPKIAISGQASLLGVTAAAHVSLSDKGFDFGCTGKVFGAFDATVTAKGASLQSADGFTVHAQMSQNFLSDLTSRAANVLQQAGAPGLGPDRRRPAGCHQRASRCRPPEHPRGRGQGRSAGQAGRRATTDSRRPGPGHARRRTRCPRSTRRSLPPGPASRLSGMRPPSGSPTPR